MSRNVRLVAGSVVLVVMPLLSLAQGPRVNPRVMELRKVINRQIQNATPAVRAKIDQVPTVPAPAQPTYTTTTPTPPPAVTADQKNLLLSKITEFQGYVKGQESKYSRWAILSIFGIAALSLTASLFSFASRNRIGGALGLIVVGVVGITNAYPIGPLSDFYRSLRAQTSALMLDCDLKDPFTADAYNAAADQLKVLMLYEADKRPQLGSSSSQVDELTQQLQVLKSSSGH